MKFDGINRRRFEPEDARQRAIEERPDGVSHGNPYRLEMIPSAREHVLAIQRRILGPRYPDGFPGAEEKLPLPGARRLRVTFVTKSMEWPFEADLTDELQERRVRELLMGSTVCGEWPASQLPTIPLSEDMVRSGIAVGDHVHVVLARLGQPGSVAGAPGDGFRLSYDLRYEPNSGMIELRFDGKQTLKEISRLW